MQMSLRENLQTTPMQTMSANTFEEDRRNAFAAGMDGHISKPIDVQVLLETLNKIFR